MTKKTKQQKQAENDGILLVFFIAILICIF